MDINDLNFFCKLLCNSISTSARIYEKGELVCCHSIYNYPPDPFIRYKEEVLNIKKKIGIFTTLLHQFYGFVELSDGKRLVIGPTGFLVREDKKLAQLMFELDVKKENQEAYINALCSAPYVGKEKFASTLALIAFLLDGEKFELEEIYDSKSQETIQIQNENIKNFTAVTLSHEVESEIIAGHNFERSLISLIQNGQVDTLKSLTKSSPNMKSGKMSQTALRQIKNTFICTATVSSRAAIKGGLDPVTAFTLSDLYIQRVEVLNDYNTINELLSEVMLDYASRVKNIKYGITRPSKFLQKCSQYVAQNLTFPITAEKMATDLELNRTYLSTQFKKQSGISISQYILHEKILESERLLKHTELPLSEISDRLCFSSQSHFQNAFKKFNGKTPKAFRDEI